MRRRFHFAQKRIHLVRTQPAAGAARSCGRQGRRHLVEPFLEREGGAVSADIVGEIAQRSFQVGSAKKRRSLAHQYRIRTE